MADTDTTAIDSIRLGRKSSFSGDGRIHLEVQKFAGNQPKVERVLGVEPNGHYRTQVQYPTSRSRSGGGNGADDYQVDEGLFFLRGVLDSGSRRVTALVQYRDEEVDEIEQSTPVLEELFPSDMKLFREHKRRQKEQTQIAETIRAEITEEMVALATPTREGDLVATPEFREPPSIDEVVAAMSLDAFDRDAYVMSCAAPLHFIVHQPCFAKAKTPLLAIAAALAKIKEREIELSEAQQQAASTGWPALTGSPKQIAWAETIRAKVAAKDPSTKALKTASTAKYWIDNHRAVR